jgi:hypothetical protein
VLVRDSDINYIKEDLLATGRLELVEQNLDHRFSDVYTLQVPRLRFINDSDNNNIYYNCVSLWSEQIYMLKVDGEKVEVPETHAWNPVLMEDRFDLHVSWANADSLSFTAKMANGVKILPAIRSQSPDINYPIYIPSIPRMLDAQLDQARFRIQHPNVLHSVLGNRPRYHLGNFIRYLHLEKPMQRKRLLQELSDRNRKEMEVLLDNFKRKPLATLASLQGN